MALPPFLIGEDLLKFRTRHCERFVKHGRCHFGDKCQYSHDIEWTRRPLWKYNYAPQLCHFVQRVRSPTGKETLHHTCCLHRQCPLAHSREEQMYHPKRVRKHGQVLCDRFETGQCNRYYCPFAHGTSELHGPADLDSSVETVFSSAPQDILSPPCPILLKESLQNLRLTHMETLSDCTTCSGTPCSASSSQYSTTVPSFASSLITQDARSGWSQLTPTVYYNLNTQQMETVYSFLGNTAGYLWMRRYAGVLLNGSLKRSPVSIFQLEGKSGFKLSRIYSALESLSNIKHHNLSRVYLVFRTGHTAIQPPGCFTKYLIENEETQDTLWLGLETGLMPFIEKIDLFVLNQKVEETAIPPVGLVHSIIAFLKALQALHNFRIRHGNIVPSCIQLTRAYEVRLGNLLQGVLPFSLSPLTLDILIWQSPEMLKTIATNNEEIIENSRTLASDIWSAGVCIFYLISNRSHPYGNTAQEVLENIICDRKENLKLWATRSPLLYDLVSEMLQTNPDSRITVHEALEHPIFWEEEQTSQFIEEFSCAILDYRSTLLTNPRLYASIGWLDCLIIEYQTFTGTNGSDDHVIHEYINYIVKSFYATKTMKNISGTRLSEFVNHILLQSPAGLICFTYYILTHGQTSQAIKSRVISSLFSQYPSAILLAYKELMGLRVAKTPSTSNSTAVKTKKNKSIFCPELLRERLLDLETQKNYVPSSSNFFHSNLEPNSSKLIRNRQEKDLNYIESLQRTKNTSLKPTPLNLFNISNRLMDQYSNSCEPLLLSSYPSEKEQGCPIFDSTKNTYLYICSMCPTIDRAISIAGYDSQNDKLLNTDMYCPNFIQISSTTGRANKNTNCDLTTVFWEEENAKMLEGYKCSRPSQSFFQSVLSFIGEET